MLWFILWYLVGLTGTCLLSYWDYKDGHNITLTILICTIFIALTGPFIYFAMFCIFCIWWEENPGNFIWKLKDIIIIKGKKK